MTHVLLQQPRPAKAHVICSSLLLSWCFSFCNIIRNGCLAVPLPNQVSSWDSWDFTNTGHCKVIHLHKSPGAYSHMFQNKPEKSQNGTGHDDLAKKIGQKSSKGASYLTSVGPMDPKNSTCLLLKEWEKENIRIHINASSAAASASSVASASASASLAWGFYSWSRATCRLRKKKVPKSSFSTTSANMCNPCFSTYPGATSHVYICVLYNTKSPQEEPRHISSAAACFLAGASASATSSEAGSWQWSYAIECQVELVESVSIPPTHTTTHTYIYIYNPSS